MYSNIRKGIFGVMVSSTIMLLGSCSSEISMPEETANDPYSVSLTLGGSAASATGSRAVESDQAVTGTQTEEESHVYNLFAVVFKDLDSGASLKQIGAVAANDPCAMVIDFTNDASVSKVGEEYTFYLREMGTYNICFVANADDDLKSKLNSLTNGGTYSTFKNLVVTKAPEHKAASENDETNTSASGMTMTSKSYGVVINGTSPSNLGTINLSRIMARIDIYNAAPNIIINKIKFNGRMIMTPLIENYDYDAANVEPDDSENSEYQTGDNGLPGANIIKEEDNSYKAQIYSYSHYGSTSDGTAPSLMLYYSIKEGDKVTEVTNPAEVKFTKKDGADLNLERNNLYRLYITQKDGHINFEIIVANWNEGKTFDYSDLDIISNDWNVDAAVERIYNNYIGAADAVVEEGMDTLANKAIAVALKPYANNAQAELGDFMRSDGKIMKSLSIYNAKRAYEKMKGQIDLALDSIKPNLPEKAYLAVADGIQTTIDELNTKIETAQHKIVGIVAYLFANSSDEHRYDKIKGEGFKTGLVFSLKYADNGSLFTQNASITLQGTTYTRKDSELYKDVFGYFDALEAKKYVEENSTTMGVAYPALAHALSYKNEYGEGSDIPNTTGWYIGGVGEYFDIFGVNGIGKTAVFSNFATSSTEGRHYFGSGNAGNNIVYWFKLTGLGYQVPFNRISTYRFRVWTSTKVDDNNLVEYLCDPSSGIEFISKFSPGSGVPLTRPILSF